MDRRTSQIHVPSTGRTTKWGTATFDGTGRVMISMFSPVGDPHPFMLTDQLTIGRAEQDQPDLQVNLQAFGAFALGVSRRHARLERFGKNVMLTDLNSSNGTFLNGAKCQPWQQKLVRDGDEIKLGQMTIYIYCEKPSPQQGTSASPSKIHRRIPKSQ